MKRERASVRRARAAIGLGVALVMVLGLLAGVAAPARAAGPCAELAYANGQEYCIFIAKIITNPSPHLQATAEPIYIAAYPQLPGGCDPTDPASCGPLTLPSGYQPLCNPCFHGGTLNDFPYHDHVMSGAPGQGNQGTAGEMKGPWLLLIVEYTSSYGGSASFAPFTSTTGIASGEQTGDFQVLDASAANPYEIDTGLVLIFGVQPLGS